MTASLHPRPCAHPLATALLATLAALIALASPAAHARQDLAERALAMVAGQPANQQLTAAEAPLTLRSEDAPLFTHTASNWPTEQARYSEVTGWLSPERPSSLGLTLGLLTAPDASGTHAAPVAYDLGLRWRSRLQQRLHLDVQAWARSPQRPGTPDALGMIWAREPASVGTRLEVQWKASRTGGLIPEFGAIGVQLQGDARLLLRARHGGPMVYYRAKF